MSILRKRKMIDRIEVQSGKRPLENDENVQCKVQNQSDGSSRVGVVLSIDNSTASVSPDDNQGHGGDNFDLCSPFHGIGRDNSISSLIQCSTSDYGSITSLNSEFRSLVRNGDLYRLRRKNGVIEHWVYFSCQSSEWEVFDPTRRRWMHLPTMNPNECFMLPDKESFVMNERRCMFGSASHGEIAILDGGCDSQGIILSSAVMYNSEEGTWRTLPRMNQPRKMCSCVFMDGKFYVIGGTGGPQSKLLTYAEEFDLVTGTWTEIPNMSPVQPNPARIYMPPSSQTHPLVAILNNQLYAADYDAMEVRMFYKESKAWVTIGQLPKLVVSWYGSGLDFRACGDSFIVVGGTRVKGKRYIELNSWVPGEGPPQWNLLGRKRTDRNFVYN